MAYHAAEKVLILPEARFHLDSVDLDDPPRLLDLPHGDIAESNASDGSSLLQIGECADARSDRDPRIGRVELIEIEGAHAECEAAVFRAGDEGLRTTIRHPASARPRHAPFGRDEDGRAVAG